jgi:hypothetical protein
MEWTCARCGAVHRDLPLDFAFDQPHYWSPEYEQTGKGRLTSDLCVIEHAEGKDFFVRGLLELPIPELGTRFAYGLWTTLSERNFDRVVALWDDPKLLAEPAYFGWIANSVPGYPETLNLKSHLRFTSPERRPSVTLEPSSHPLAREQHEGIRLERVREIAELNLHG